MHSIFRNAIDRVSVIKEAVEQSIEEVVKNNSKDSTNVLNTGASITSSIASWAEKSSVSKRANHIKNSATTLVEELASGIKGVTNNISLQNHVNIGDRFVISQNKEESAKYNDCPNEYMHVTNNIISSEVNNSGPICSHVTENITNYSSEDEIKTIENDVDLLFTANTENNDIALICNSPSRDHFEHDNLNRGLIAQFADKNENDYPEDKVTLEDKIIENETRNEMSSYSCSMKPSTIIFPDKSLDVIEIKDNLDDYCTSEDLDCKNLNLVTDFQYKKNNVNPEDKKNTNSYRLETKTVTVSNTNNPLSVFKQIENLEKENSLLKEEIRSLRVELLGLNKKLTLNENIINKLTHKNLYLTNENKLLSSKIVDMQNEAKIDKTCLSDFEKMSEKLNKIEIINEKQKNTIKVLQEKIVELENVIHLGEAGKMESTVNFQREMAELRQQLLLLNETENKISLPYINRIRTLENQLNETRISHSKEIRRFESIIENLRDQNSFEKKEYQKLENLLNEERISYSSNIDKLEFQIKHYKDTIKTVESRKNTHILSKPMEVDFNKTHLRKCIKIINISIIGDSTSDSLSEKDIEEKQNSLRGSLFKSCSKKNVKNINPLEEELKQIIIDKQLLEEDYIRICDERRHIENILFEEKQRGKLLQQQLDNMLKLVSDITDKLDNTNEIVKLQKIELQLAHSRLK